MAKSLHFGDGQLQTSRCGPVSLVFSLASEGLFFNLNSVGLQT